MLQAEKMPKTFKTIYELSALYDARKSFYGKAKVITFTNGVRQLWSYDTNVAAITPQGVLQVFGGFEMTATTRRHIREFALQNGFNRNCVKIGTYQKVG